MAFIDITAKTVEEAIQKATETLSDNNIVIGETEVIETPSNGVFGLFGKKEGKIRVFYEVSSDEKVVESKETTAAKETVDTTTEDIEITAEQIEAIADRAKTFLASLFEKMGLQVMIEKRINDSQILFQVHGDNLGLLIGKHGQTLDSIQYLTSLVANKGERSRFQIMVDVEEYRSRRERTLKHLAKRLAEKVQRTHRREVLEPMNAYERKIIHTALQDVENVKTTSEGEGPSRHIVIEYIR